MKLTREQFVGRVIRELGAAYVKHGRAPWSRHEFYAVLREEVDELWDAIKCDASGDAVMDEMVQVAAMCLRFAEQRSGFQFGGVEFDDGSSFELASFAGGGATGGEFSALTCDRVHPDGTRELMHYTRTASEPVRPEPLSRDEDAL